MPKSLTTQATVISVKQTGDNFSTVTLLSETEGIIFATLYGGPKSKLKSLVSSWNTGIAYLSNSKIGNNFKISDFDVKKYHLSFRESIEKNCAASIAAEIAIKTKCAGNNTFFWKLFTGFIDGLEYCTTAEQCSVGLLRFFWRYLELAGVRPDATKCTSCEETFLTRKIDTHNVSYGLEGAFYNPVENAFFCTGCTKEKMPFFLSLESIRYLAALSVLTPKEARFLPLTKESAGQIKELLFYLIESACGTRLKSIETGMGIL